MNDRLEVRIGTRTSRLSRWQASRIVCYLERISPGIFCQTKTLITEGDRKPGVPLSEMAGRGVFTSRLEEALRDGEIDIAVHSLKDLPTEQDPSLCLAAVPSRGDPRECLVARCGGLAELPRGAVIGTSSSRREAQLRALRPDLVFRPIRGNVDSRIAKVLEMNLYDATLLAAAGIRRLGLEKKVKEWFPLERMLPAPGQAALAVQCRSDDSKTRALLSRIDDRRVRGAVTAERSFLEALGGGCALPVAAFARWMDRSPGGELLLRGAVFSPHGQKRIWVSGIGKNPEELGRRLADRAMRRGALQFIPGHQGRARPLAGRRIVVTRAADQAGYLADRLRELGARPVLVPVIRIAPREGEEQVGEAIARLPGYDWIVFTSSYAVTNWWRLVSATTARPVAKKTRVAAVGPATAATLQEKGVEVEVVPQEYSKAKLVEALGNVQGLRILVPRGELAGPALSRSLEEQGALVDDVLIYQTVLVEPDEEQANQLAAGMDAVLFTSSSTVKGFVAALHRSSLAPSDLDGVTMACIGPATARTARELGLTVQVIARHYTTEGLVEALVDHYREGGDDPAKPDS